jgi:hypothetical protein
MAVRLFGEKAGRRSKEQDGRLRGKWQAGPRKKVQGFKRRLNAAPPPGDAKRLLDTYAAQPAR